MNVREVSLFSVSVRDRCLCENVTFKVVAHTYQEACVIAMREAVAARHGRAGYDLSDEDFERLQEDHKLAGWRLLDDEVLALLPMNQRAVNGAGQ